MPRGLRELKGLLSWGGRTSRREYFLGGLGLVAFKFILDTWVAERLLGLEWHSWYYLHLVPWQYLNADPVGIVILLMSISVPFAWIGVSLTIRRLRDAALPFWQVLFFFVPLVNLIYFATLCLARSIPAGADADSGVETASEKGLDSPWGSALAATVITTLMALGGIACMTTLLESYGIALFVGLPFCVGLSATLLYGCSRVREWRESRNIALLTLSLICIGLLVFAMEGLICLLMAAPFALILTLLGALVGHSIQRLRWDQKEIRNLLLILLFSLPLLTGAEVLTHPPPSVFPVRTTIDIHAPPNIVWNNVVTFSDLPAPTEWIFHTGLSYPVRAQIEGHGVGAIRRCVFSTGEFVEPITVWDPPRLLRFAVTSTPVPMHELNPFREVHPRHLDGYFVSRQGQFLLQADGHGGTRLEGTTWYQHGLWPELYWKWWSDSVLHTIHFRVLDHIKALSENPPPL